MYLEMYEDCCRMKLACKNLTINSYVLLIFNLPLPSLSQFRDRLFIINNYTQSVVLQAVQ